MTYDMASPPHVPVPTPQGAVEGVADPATHVPCTTATKRQGERRRCLRYPVSRNLRAALRAGGIPSENAPRKGPAGRPRALARTAPIPAGGGRKCRSPPGRGPLTEAHGVPLHSVR